MIVNWILLNRLFRLTAAHCSQGQNSRPQSVYAVVGALHLDSDGLRVDLDRITPHEQYSKNRNINDISLLRTAKEIAFSRNVQPIALPTNNIEGNVHVLLSGWGRTSVRCFCLKLAWMMIHNPYHSIQHQEDNHSCQMFYNTPKWPQLPSKNVNNDLEEIHNFLDKFMTALFVQ